MNRVIKWSVALSCAVVLTGCGTMLPGTIYSEDGKVMPFQIERAYRTGKVSATDPSTGELFKGTYVGILERTSAFSSGFSNGQANFSGTAGSGTVTGSGTSFGVASVGSNIANATAYLSGDKGTMLTCEMKIEAGLVPHGIGGCGDNKARNIGCSSNPQ